MDCQKCHNRTVESIMDLRSIKGLILPLVASSLVYTNLKADENDQQVFRLDPILSDSKVEPKSKLELSDGTQDAKRAALQFWRDVEGVIQEEKQNRNAENMALKKLDFEKFKKSTEEINNQTKEQLKEAIQILLKQVASGYGDERTAKTYFALAESYRQLELVSGSSSRDSKDLVVKSYLSAIQSSSDQTWLVNPSSRLFSYYFLKGQKDYAYATAMDYFAGLKRDYSRFTERTEINRFTEMTLRAGDIAYELGNLKEARDLFEAPFKIFEKDERVVDSEIKLETHYRLTWLYFKLNLVELAVQQALETLDSRHVHSSAEKAERMRRDVCEVLAAISFEASSQSRSQAILTQGGSRLHLDTFAVAYLRLLIKSGRLQDARDFGDRFQQQKKLYLKSPLVVFLTAYAERKLSNDFTHIRRLELLHSYYRTSSAWQSAFNSTDPEAQFVQRNMQNAMVYLADSSYSRGAAGAHMDSLKAALESYELLTQNSADHSSREDLVRWDIQRAHTLYLLGRFDGAHLAYSKILEQDILTAEERDLCMFQKVNSNIRGVTSKIAQLSLAKPEVKKDEIAEMVKNEIATIEKDLEQYLNQFPDAVRSLELIASTAGMNFALQNMSKSFFYFLKIAENQISAVYVDRGILGVISSIGAVSSPIERARHLAVLLNGSAKRAKSKESIQSQLVSALNEQINEAAKAVVDSPEMTVKALELLELVASVQLLPSSEKVSMQMLNLFFARADWKNVISWAKPIRNRFTAKEVQSDCFYFEALSFDRLLDYRLALGNYLDFLRSVSSTEQRFEKSYLRAIEIASLLKDNNALNILASMSLSKVSRESVTVEKFNTLMEKLFTVERWDDAQNYAKDFRLSQKDSESVIIADFWMAKILMARGSEEDALQRIQIIAQRIESNGLIELGEVYRDALAEAYLTLAKASIEDYRAYAIPDDSDSKADYLASKMSLFRKLSADLEKCFSLGSTNGSFEAQYIRAELARELADFISGLTSRKGSLPEGQLGKLRSIADGLKVLSRESHSKNALYGSRSLANRNSKKSLGSDPWIRKSTVALGQGSGVEDENSKNLPVSLVAPGFMPF